jgi:phage gp36-like protein
MTDVASYTTVERILSEVPAIGSASNVTSLIVCRYAANVEAKINAKLSRLYTLPFTNDIPVLTALATDLTIFDLLTKRVTAHFTDQQNTQNPYISLRKDAWAMVDEISEGNIPLITSSGVAIAAATSVAITSNTKGYQPTFHNGKWEDMIQDPDRIDAQLSDRGLL